tara:strand:+ start:118 stop:351 length:234 start_codon:yes stop_codon:yes gene_type:complete
MYKSNQQELFGEMNKAFDVAVWNVSNSEKNGHGIDWDLVQSEVWSKVGNFISATNQAPLATSWFDWSVEEHIKTVGG